MSTKPSAEVTRILEWVRSEIMCGGSLGSHHDDKVWNDATVRAAAVVDRYKNGDGLHQMIEANKLAPGGPKP